jgi:hypothetical protein
MRKGILAAVGLIFFSAPAISGATLKVPTQFASVQAAIDAATAGDTVAVSVGTYSENIDLKNGVAVLGGWDAAFSIRNPVTYQTTIDAHSSGSAVTAYWPVDSTCVLDGFKLTNGSGTEDELNPGLYLGGGILVYNTQGPRIENNEIVGNSVPNGSGGGIFVHDASPIIEHNTIRDNHCSGSGGGIDLGNSCCGRVLNNVIANNTADRDGGGIRADLGAFVFEDNEVSGNRCGINGGGISLDHSAARIARNTISGNTARYFGGGVFGYAISSVIQGNLIVDNIGGAGGGVLCQATPTPTIRSNTVAGNSSNERGQISLGSNCSATVDHNIVACSMKGSGIHCSSDCAPTVSCNDVWGNVGGNYGGDCPDRTGQDGNISDDPMFCNVGAHDYSLASGSPALNPPSSPSCNSTGIGYRTSPGCDSAPDPSCDYGIGVKKESWGNIKSLYRK